MVQLMLDDLRRKAREYLLLFLESSVLIPYGNQIVTHRFSRSRQREASFLRLIRHNLGNNTGIEHFRIYAFVKKSDDAFVHTDHVCRHPHAFVCVRQQRVTKIVCNGKVRGGRRQRLLSQKEDILLNGSDQIV